MYFSEALKLLEEGKMIKMPSWGGYWKKENDTIMMHCKDGEVIDIRDTKDTFYTVRFMASNEWIEATKENTPILGGKLNLTFRQAVEYIRKGKMMRRLDWKEGAYVQQVGNILITHGLPLVNSLCPIDMISNDWEFYNE